MLWAGRRGVSGCVLPSLAWLKSFLWCGAVSRSAECVVLVTVGVVGMRWRGGASLDVSGDEDLLGAAVRGITQNLGIVGGSLRTPSQQGTTATTIIDPATTCHNQPPAIRVPTRATNAVAHSASRRDSRLARRPPTPGRFHPQRQPPHRHPMSDRMPPTTSSAY